MDKIKFRQLIFIVFLLAVAMKMFTLPTFIMRLSGRSCFLVMLISCVIDLVMLAVVLTIMHISKDDFFTTLQKCFGKVCSKIILVVLIIYYTIKLLVMLIELKIFFSTSVLTIPLSPLHMLPLLLLLLFVSGKKLSVLGRAAELISPIVLVSMLALGGLSILNVDFTDLLPLWDGTSITDKLINFPIWFGDFFMLLLFMNKTDCRKKIYFTLLAGGVGLAVMVTLSAIMFAIYIYIPEVLTYGHNISNMTQYSVLSFKFGRFDLLIFSIWLLGSLVVACSKAMFIFRCGEHLFGEERAVYVSISSVVALFIGLCFLDSANETYEFMIKYFTLGVVTVQDIFPIVLLIRLITLKKPTPKKISTQQRRLKPNSSSKRCFDEN